MQLAHSLRPPAGLGGAARWQKPAPRGLGAGLVHRPRHGLLLKEVRAGGGGQGCASIQQPAAAAGRAGVGAGGPEARRPPQPARRPACPPPQAAQTDQIVAEGEGGANGAAPAAGGAGAEPVVVGDLAAVQASLEAKLNGNGNGSNGNGNGAGLRNGSGAGPLATVSIDAAEGVEGFLPPEEAGQLETAAQVGAGELLRSPGRLLLEMRGAWGSAP